MSSAEPSSRPTVVLLHGLGRSARSLSRIRRALEADGYPTWARTYPSRRLSIDGLAALVGDWIERDLPDRELMAVTHSLGGILVRHIGARLPWRRIVMLAPPNGGSVVAERMAGVGLYRWVFGPAGQDVASGEGWPQPPAPCGVVAGTRGPTLTNVPSWMIAALGLLPDTPHDGTVTVDETRGARHADFATVDAGHTSIMNHPETLALALRFLGTGRFAATEAGA